MVTPLREGQKLLGESGDSYTVVSPLGVQPGVAPNVWAAVDTATQGDVFILKQPGGQDDYFGSRFRHFQSEMIMHELFKDCPYIRRQVDRIPPRKNSQDPPRLVLEPTETTLWDARLSRPLSDTEIKTIMRGVLLGLREIHGQGLVYADLKMQNIFVNGFRSTKEQTSTDNVLIAMIGDLGTVMEPFIGKVQPLAYRCPEVHFKQLITAAADIWGWGMIFCHLLQAQKQHSAAGLYEFTSAKTMQEAELAIQRAMWGDFDLGNNAFYEKNAPPPGYTKPIRPTWQERLRADGVQEQYIDFLKWVMNPSPFDRPTAQQILEHPLLGGKGPMEPRTMAPPAAPARHTSEPMFSPLRQKLPEWTFSPPSNTVQYMTSGKDVQAQAEQAQSNVPAPPVFHFSNLPAWQPTGGSGTGSDSGYQSPYDTASPHGTQPNQTSDQSTKAPPPLVIPYKSDVAAERSSSRPSPVKSYSESGKATGGLFNNGLMSMLRNSLQH